MWILKEHEYVAHIAIRVNGDPHSTVFQPVVTLTVTSDLCSWDYPVIVRNFLIENSHTVRIYVDSE